MGKGVECVPCVPCVVFCGLVTGGRGLECIHAFIYIHV